MDADGDRDAPTRQTPKLSECADDPGAICKGMAGLRVVRSEELLQGQREVYILHGGQVYRLLRTRNDKLTLQK